MKNIGVIAYGLKAEIITSQDDILEVIKRTIQKEPDLVKENDILCITEAVLAITQNNIVTVDKVSLQIKNILNIEENSTIGLIHPILSRNRFSMILKSIARTVPKGKIIIQLGFPADEQGNALILKDTIKKLGKELNDSISLQELGKDRMLHPETELDYIDFYENIIKEQGAQAEIFLANDPKYLVKKNPQAIIVCNVHARNELLEEIKSLGYKKVITLQDIYSDSEKKEYSEFGLLGSNILDPAKEEIKLCPKEADKVCQKVKEMIYQEFKKNIEVIVYGDGSYKDPESGIHELADPVSCFGSTQGIKNKNRVGVKTKYLMRKLCNEGKSKLEIEEIILQERKKLLDKNNFNSQGTTPRKIENLVSSLADLVSGSADANTPFVIVRNFY